MQDQECNFGNREGVVEGDKVSLSQTGLSPRSRCTCNSCLLLHLAGRLERAPLLASSLCCGGEPLWSALPAPRVASLALPSLCLSNQSSQFARAQFFIVFFFFTPTGQVAPAWLSGFCFLVDLVWSPLRGVFCLSLQGAFLSMISH